MIDLLLTDFFPDEPCAAGVSLCPPGYEIPALQADIRKDKIAKISFILFWSFSFSSFFKDFASLYLNYIRSMLGRGWSFLAEDPEDRVVAAVICDLEHKDGAAPEVKEGAVYPDKFLKLERFFDDLKGRFDVFQKVDN